MCSREDALYGRPAIKLKARAMNRYLNVFMKIPSFK
jgi:hypothetical protein